jgi:hypothetical protein
VVDPASDFPVLGARDFLRDERLTASAVRPRVPPPRTPGLLLRLLHTTAETCLHKGTFLFSCPARDAKEG